jgi:hypothetical protein
MSCWQQYGLPCLKILLGLVSLIVTLILLTVGGVFVKSGGDNSLERCNIAPCPQDTRVGAILLAGAVLLLLVSSAIAWKWCCPCGSQNVDSKQTQEVDAAEP